MTVPLDVLLAEPRYLLHRVDLAADRLTFVDTTRASLCAASFLDGRVAFGSGDPILVPLSRALAVAPRVAGPDRFVFHVSFCGSTLLARLFDVPGQAFSYKEPQALVDLADAGVSAPQDERFAPAIDLVLGQLRLQWAAGEATVIKPSNWVNAILPQLVAASRDMRFVLCDILPRDFLSAVFRGGRERIVYTLQCCNHIVRTYPDYTPYLAAASRSADPLVNAAQLTLLALHLQHRAFDTVDPNAQHRLFHREIVSSVDACLSRAADILDVTLSPQDRAAAVDAHGGSHAKSRCAFDILARDADDERIEALHGPRFDAALVWADATLPAVQPTLLTDT